MKHLHLIFALAWLLVGCGHTGSPLLNQLEEELAKREKYKQEKEERIERLKKELEAQGASAEKRLFICEELYEQYATFQFDSAMSVVNLQAELAAEAGDRTAAWRSDLHRIMLFATAGYFSELKGLMEALPTYEFSADLKLEYFKTAEWAYNRMADYLGDEQLSPQYYALGSAFQDSIMRALPAESLDSRYYKACRAWNSADTDSLIADFLYIYERTTPEQRLYAQATWNLSWLYERKGDKERHREFLVRAAISDQRAQLKESLALQELAMQLKRDGGNEARANRYLSLAIEDALFYGNRLRLLEISKKVPDIVVDYERQLERANKTGHIVIACVGVLALLNGIAIFALAVSMRRLHNERKLIEAARDELKAANEQTETANRQLHEANGQLREQTRLRESCICLFMELTAAYINKLNTFQLNVQRKVKTNQIADLLKLANPSRMSEQDAKDFFMSFDKTFLSTFPDFVERVNALMREEERFTLSESNVLNLDLRILALMRLGVKDTAKIATLLNCSQQTVYNHRSAVKARAINKESFDEDLMKE